MGALRPRQPHPDLLKALGNVATPPVRLIRLASGGRARIVELECICWLEELATGKTKVHLANGDSLTVDEAEGTVAGLMESA